VIGSKPHQLAYARCGGDSHPNSGKPASQPLSHTQEIANLRVSPVDGMPQVYIPAGAFHMGGF
jgi:hypothetical protein